MRVRSEKDLWSGVLYIGLAAAFLWFGRDFRMGTASRMGPGYFPLVLAWVLLAFGLLSAARSFLVEGERIGAIALKPLAIVAAAVVLFGLLLTPLGLVVALPVLIIVSAMASSQSVYDLKGALIVAGLTLFCSLVFVKGLGVPMPIFGSWFDGLVPATWQR